MLALLVGAALRSLVLAAAVWLVLRIPALGNTRMQLTAWIIVLAAALLMPVVAAQRITLCRGSDPGGRCRSFSMAKSRFGVLAYPGGTHWYNVAEWHRASRDWRLRSRSSRRCHVPDRPELVASGSLAGELSLPAQHSGR
jgi:hypothetical protein